MFERFSDFSELDHFEPGGFIQKMDMFFVVLGLGCRGGYSKKYKLEGGLLEWVIGGDG